MKSEYKMKLLLVVFTLSTLVFSIHCRPQNVQIQKQNIVLVARSLEPINEQRGSIEETNRILKEIERINVAMGYKKRIEAASPRGNGGDSLFFPKEAVLKPPNHKGQNASPKQINGIPVPVSHLQLPSSEPPKNFKLAKHLHKHAKSHGKKAKKAKKVFSLPIIVASGEQEYNIIDKRFGRKGKSKHEASELSDLNNIGKQNPEVTNSENEEDEEGLFEELIQTIGEAATDEEEAELISEAISVEEEEEEEDEEEGEEEEKDDAPTTEFPLLPNDKFINTKLHPFVGDDRVVSGRNFNFTTVFQNITNRIFTSTTKAPKIDSDIMLKEEPDIEIEMGEEKGPFGLFSPTLAERQVQQGGLVIQRLRVRQGGIAIAGPGGVATAGSGGTAIVGPNGTAITHPRSLTIAGPGAKIYAIPESLDLGIAIYNTTQTRKLPKEAVLVANGPTIYYNS